MNLTDLLPIAEARFECKSDRIEKDYTNGLIDRVQYNDLMAELEKAQHDYYYCISEKWYLNK